MKKKLKKNICILEDDNETTNDQISKMKKKIDKLKENESNNKNLLLTLKSDLMKYHNEERK